MHRDDVIYPDEETHAFLDLETAFLAAYEERGSGINQRPDHLLPANLAGAASKVNAQIRRIRKTCNRVENSAVLSRLLTKRQHGSHLSTMEVSMNRPFLLIAHSDKQHPSLYEASDETDARNTAETILAQQQHVINVDVLQLVGSCRRAVNVQWSNGPKEIPA